MVFVYHYVTILFDPQNSYKKDSKILTIEYHGGERLKVIHLLHGCTGVAEPKHALLILQGGGSKRGGSGWLETLHFTLLRNTYSRRCYGIFTLMTSFYMLP